MFLGLGCSGVYMNGKYRARGVSLGFHSCTYRTVGKQYLLGNNELSTHH
jgi:hypothetical protein